MEKEVLEHDCFFGGSARGGGCGSADNSDLFLRLNGKSDQELANHKCANSAANYRLFWSFEIPNEP